MSGSAPDLVPPVTPVTDQQGRSGQTSAAGVNAAVIAVPVVLGVAILAAIAAAGVYLMKTRYRFETSKILHLLISPAVPGEP